MRSGAIADEIFRPLRSFVELLGAELLRFDGESELALTLRDEL